jgi:transposase
MPSSHRRFADWTIERITREASAIGPDAALLCEKILADRPHPEQGFRACLGVIRLVKGFGRERVNAACGRVLEIGAIAKQGNGYIRKLLVLAGTLLPNVLGKRRRPSITRLSKLGHAAAVYPSLARLYWPLKLPRFKLLARWEGRSR